jgi:putative two-component system response regulator
VEELLARQYETPVPPRNLRPDVPLELEAIICQMMALDPNDRYPTPLALIAALDDFLRTAARPEGPLGLATLSSVLGDSHGSGLAARTADGAASGPDTLSNLLLPTRPSQVLTAPRSRRVLVVSPRADCRRACRTLLERHGLDGTEAAHEGEVDEALRRAPADVVLVDGGPAGGAGLELCRRLRREAPLAHLKLILLADPRPGGEEAPPAEAEGLCPALMDDVAPWGSPALLSRVRLALRLKEAEERSDRLASHLLATNGQLEHALQQRDNTALQTQEVLIFAMAKMAELRGQETGAHLLRMQSYVRVLAEEALRLPAFAPCMDDAFVRMLERCVLLHDIGKVAIPDHVLLKPGKLDAEERSIMESHTLLGANLLEAVARQHGACLAFLNMAIDIVRHHHERYDGNGYPDGLAGDAIPLAARMVTLADTYDAMRSKLVYKPGLAHAAVRRLMLDPTQGQFDPALLVAFRACEALFAEIFAQRPD